ncbi:MAG: xanthine dehydrogenase family protein molybdopterin-binding subunit [Lachnospiraceae bacterium]
MEDQKSVNGVGSSVKKVDSWAIVHGHPIYTEDICPQDVLVVKALRSPHAHAQILGFHLEKALKVPGIAGIYTYKDVPQNRHTRAGQTAPEPSPYDRMILDPIVRYVGDEVCIVAGETEAAVDRALKLIQVEYRILESILDFEHAIDHGVIVHDHDDYHVNFDIGNQVRRNICASGTESYGDVEAEFARSDVILERTYYTKANNQGMMEPFKTFSFMDQDDQLVVVTSTQIPFHIRRFIANVFDMKEEKISIRKPNVGGGFGAKQTLVAEFFPVLVTLKTGKPARMYYSREEVMTASTSRHQMRITVKIGAARTGEILGIRMDTLSNTGAYGEHAPTTVGLSAHKTIPIYNKAKAFCFQYNVVYTNTSSAGAFRGYGATQGCFAMESCINELAHLLSMDPTELRLKNLVSVGETMPAYYNEVLLSGRLDACITEGKKMIEWEKKFPFYYKNGKKRSLGMAVTMQGSSIPEFDYAEIKVIFEKGQYRLLTGAADMGQACDTILLQMLASSLEIPYEELRIERVNTDHSPYDTGSYASSTTYLTGIALSKACDDLKTQIRDLYLMKYPEEKDENIIVVGTSVSGRKRVFISELTESPLIGFGQTTSPVSPPPFIAGFVEIETDEDTCEVKVIDYAAVVDCGTRINPNLTRVQAEGGIVQGIGMALFEDITYNAQGKMLNDSFLKYKIPSKLDMGQVRVAFQDSYEPTHPFGAKSIGEVVINTPAPAIAAAVYNGFGVNVRDLPITSQKIFDQCQKLGVDKRF